MSSQNFVFFVSSFEFFVAIEKSTVAHEGQVVLVNDSYFRSEFHFAFIFNLNLKINLKPNFIFISTSISFENQFKFYFSFQFFILMLFRKPFCFNFYFKNLIWAFGPSVPTPALCMGSFYTFMSVVNHWEFCSLNFVYNTWPTERPITLCAQFSALLL